MNPSLAAQAAPLGNLPQNQQWLETVDNVEKLMEECLATVSSKGDDEDSDHDVHEGSPPGGAENIAVDPDVHEDSPPPYHRISAGGEEHIAVDPDVHEDSPPGGAEHIAIDPDVHEDSPPPYHHIAIDPDSTPCTKKDMQQAMAKIFDKFDTAMNFMISSISSISSTSSSIISIRDEVSEVKKTVFSCSHCTIRFYTMDAKVGHEKKHDQPAVWAQCDQPACRMFYQVARGNCRCAKK